MPRRLLLLLLIVLACLPAPAGASWPHDPTTNLLVSTKAGNQDFSSIAPDGSGGAYIAWTDGTDGKAYVQRVSALGVSKWSAGGIAVTATAGGQSYPVCVADGAGGVFIVWQDHRNGVDYDIYAQRLDSTGTAQWTANGVAVCTVSGDQQAPRAIQNGSSGVIVAWYDLRSGTNTDIRAQSVSATGAILWSGGGTDVCSQASEQADIDLCSDGADGAIISWEDHRAADYDIYAQHVESNGRLSWTTNGIPVCNAAGYQTSPKIATDGSGGAILAWCDQRGSYDIYAQRIGPTGAPAWTANGIPVCTAAGTQSAVVIVPDGSGGVILAWQDARAPLEDIYAQRVDGTGGALWAANGVAVCAGNYQQLAPTIAQDAVGGALIGWTDSRSGNIDIYAQHLTAAGTPSWTTNGIPVSTASESQITPAVVSDGAGGAILAWWDMRSGMEVYAQRVASAGLPGALQPVIDRVRDVPADQGGAVQVLWTGSALDAAPGLAIESYALWRRLDVSAAQAALARGAQWAGATPAPGELRVSGDGAQAAYWEFLASIPARGTEGYAYTVATSVDSTGASLPWNRFMVDARLGASPTFYSSPVDSGYSVDNLAPAMPAPFTGTYAGGSASLSWGASTAPDLFAFRLHRGTTAGFTPGPGNLVATQQETAFNDAAGAPCFYKLCAVDVHGNISPYAFLLPAGTVDAPGSLPRELALSAPAPNPLRSGTTLRLALPRAAQVALTVLDAQGRRVRTLLAGAQPAGEHAITWDGRDDGGRRMADGIYVVRLACEGRVITRRIAALR